MGAILLALTLMASAAQAQPPDSTSTPAAPADSVAPPSFEVTHPPPAETTSKNVKSTFTRSSEERDRFEIGAGVVQGFFDAVGSFGYRRFLGQGPALESAFMGEITGTSHGHLTEGGFGAYLLLRPWKTYRESWRIRPLIEAGPGVHTVVQAASLEGLDKSRYKAHVYIKTHGYLGFEALVTRKLGFLVRGRVSIPSHRPLDYAQAAIFLR